MYPIDTTITDPRDPNFPCAGMRVTFNVDGRRDWSRVYTCSPEVIAWDGLHPETNFLLGSRVGCFRPVVIKEREDKSRYRIPNSNNAWGRKATITFNKGTEEEQKRPCYIEDL